VIDAAGRPFTRKGEKQLAARAFVTFGNHDNPAIREVSRRPDETELQRPRTRVPAETHALHAPVDPGGEADDGLCG
jgi:hypothetical protein